MKGNLMLTGAGVLATLAGCQTSQHVDRDRDQQVDVIAFGSCAREDRTQEIWDSIIATNPDLFLFIGDNMYADIPDVPDSPAVIKTAYDNLEAKPGYRKLRSRVPILPTWDDHDFGINDGGKEWALKKESQELFLDFYGVPEDSPRRDREGIYHAEVYGPPGRRVQIILLDTRYHRDPLTRNPLGRPEGRGPYVPNSYGEGTILGEEQWTWLQEQLRVPADVRVVASSIQVVANEHGWETWGNMPHERDRFYGLIDETDASGVVVVSGDRHLIEISKDHTAPYPMWTSPRAASTGARATRWVIRTGSVSARCCVSPTSA
ncbi:MAG: alkaline phosphatase D family protein [Planctomycetota bacterium]